MPIGGTSCSSWSEGHLGIDLLNMRLRWVRSSTVMAIGELVGVVPTSARALSGRHQQPWISAAAELCSEIDPVAKFTGHYMSSYDPDSGPYITKGTIQWWEFSLQPAVLTRYLEALLALVGSLPRILFGLSRCWLAHNCSSKAFRLWPKNVTFLDHQSN